MLVENKRSLGGPHCHGQSGLRPCWASEIRDCSGGAIKWMLASAMSAAAIPAPTTVPRKSPWLVGPMVDILIGCGAWTIPLLVATRLAETSQVIAVSFFFYFLTIFCNNPHYMATIYRAYGTRADFSKYRFFTVYLTALLILTAVGAHFAPVVLPILFTVYLTWSPWHYTGQNFGIAMMFARRAGVQPTRTQRNLLYAAFGASYLVWFLSIHSTFAASPYILTLGIPSAVAEPLRWVLFAVFVTTAGLAIAGMSRVVGMRALMPAAILISTQFLWFVLPVFLSTLAADTAAPLYFSTGALAFMHCAQYLWITSYYARRESDTGARPSRWRPVAYYGGMVVGGIALFVPGPWLVSRVFRFNLVESYLIFSSLVNIHHFLLDGAIWKLRDGRIAALLLGTSGRASADGSARRGLLVRGAGWIMAPRARFARYGLAAAIIAIGLLDQWQYFLTMDGAPTERAALAERLNPSDSRALMRQARQSLDAGRPAEALDLVTRVSALGGLNADALRLRGNILAGAGQDDEAWLTYRTLEAVVRPDIPTLVNVGVLAARRGEKTTAIAKFRAALSADPVRTDVMLNLAEALYERGDYREAIAQYDAYIVAAGAKAKTPGELRGVLRATLRMAAAQAGAGEDEAAFETARSAAQLAAGASLPDLESQALERMSGILSDGGNDRAALPLLQQAVGRAGEARDPLLAAIQFYNLGTMLTRIEAREEEAWACLVESRRLFSESPGAQAPATLPGLIAGLEATHPVLATLPDPDRLARLRRALTQP